MKRYLAFLLALVMLLSMGVTALAADEGNFTELDPEDEGKVFIGMVKYLTGDHQQVGKYAREAADMAVAEINAAGGILGKEVELVWIDEGDGSIDQTVTAMSLALDDQRLAAMCFGYYSQNTIAALDLLDNADKPIPALVGGSGRAISEGGHEYAWLTRQIDGSGGVARVDVFESVCDNIEDIVIMHNMSTTGMDMGSSMQANFIERGYDVPDKNVIGYPVDETNFTNWVAQVKELDPDVMFINATDNEHLVNLQTLYEAGITCPMVCNSTAASNTVLQNAGDACVGIYVFNDWCNTLTTPESMAFNENFQKLYNKVPDNTNAVIYDQIYLFKHAMEQAGTTTDRAAIKDALNNVVDLPMVTGLFNSNEGHAYLNQLYVCRITEDKALEYVLTIDY